MMKDLLRRNLSHENRLRLKKIVCRLQHTENKRKFLNDLRYGHTMKNKSESIDYTPPIFGVSISAACNLSCPTCLFLLEKPNGFKKQYMTANSFNHIMEWYNQANVAKTIFIAGLGESLMNSEFDRITSIAKGYDAQLKISTNGILVDKKIESLRRFDYINVSLDAFNAETFHTFRGRTENQWKRIMAGLVLLNENRLNFSISFLLSDRNIDKIINMIQLAEAIRPKMVYFHNINPHGCENYSPLILKDSGVLRMIGTLTDKDDYPYDILIPVIFDTESDDFLTSQCIQPWSMFLVDIEGNVSHCCHFQHDAEIGNIHKGYDFNSETMISIRKGILENRIPPVCKFCERRFSDKNFARFTSKKQKWILDRQVNQKYIT